ncbi:MAG: hypothetical protein GC190_01725 [Alphaproteobacteria bacterium]|nr:hypothetical protein [Alphaproteobacteria bacterium]
MRRWLPVGWGSQGVSAYLSKLIDAAFARTRTGAQRSPSFFFPEIRLAQLKMAERSILPGVVAMPLFAVTMAMMMTAWASTQWIALWVGAVLLNTPRYWFSLALLRKEHLAPDEVKRWASFLSALTTIGNLIWIWPCIALYADAPLSGQMLFTLVAACSLAAGAAMCAPSYPHVIAPFATFAPAMVLPPLFGGDGYHEGIGILALGYCAFMAAMARVIYASARDVLSLRDDNDELITGLKIAREESEAARRRAEQAREESDSARHRADHANQAKSEFLANMSHELRTPLNAVIGFAEIMRANIYGPLGDQRYDDYVGHIHASGHHLLCLINDVLDLSRIEAGRFVLSPIDIGVADLMKSVRKYVEYSASQRGVEVVTKIAPAMPLLVADDRAVKQVVLNLLANAVKFTPEGGRVTAEARMNSAGGIDFVISDTGVGIHPDDLGKVFETFGQGEHQLARKEKGSGLGLPIARGLMEAHGGTLTLTSELGRGTTVTASFPPERSKNHEGPSGDGRATPAAAAR